MKYLLVVFILINGEWVRGDDLEGWSAISYETLDRCLESKKRANEIQLNLKRINARAFEKRFVCEPQGDGPIE